MASNPAIASRLQSSVLVGRVAELGSFGLLTMSTRLEISVRFEAGVIATFLVIWVVLWQLPQHVWLPIPPYRQDPGASLGVQSLAYAWATLLLLLPFLLPVFGGHFTVRQWARGAASRLFAMVLCTLALFPIVVVGVGILRRIIDPSSLDSAETLLFYWWPR